MCSVIIQYKCSDISYTMQLSQSPIILYIGPIELSTKDTLYYYIHKRIGQTSTASMIDIPRVME